jgi:cobalt/nickel transport system ATP-binding protein
MRKAIAIKNLSYTYPDGTKALENINMEIQEGERVAIAGPNGAGKTTLLLHLNGILHPEGGEVEVWGRKIEKKRREEIIKDVGIVFQDPDDQLFMPTLFDDVAFGPLNLGLKKEKVRERVREALFKVGLSGYEERCPHHLSYGEKKKASLAAVISMKPKILVLDEPTANLDPKSRRELIRIVKGVNEKENVTVIIATHDVNALPELVDRIYVLKKRVIGGGTLREVFSDFDLLNRANLDVPEIFKLFEVLRCFGYQCEKLPLSMEEAIQHLTNTIKTQGGHIHLHIHEHTHTTATQIKNKYQHHG